MTIADPAIAWIGLLDALGVAFVFVLWLLLRESGDRVRTLAATVGATFLAVQISSAVSLLGGLASRLALTSQFGQGDDDEVGHFLIALVALVAGLVVVLAGHRLVAPVEDVEDDEPVVEAEPLLIVGTAEIIENGNHDDAEAYEDDEDYVDWVPPRRDLSRWATWFDVAVLALVVALPTASLSSLFSRTLEVSGDVTVMIVLQHVLTGLVGAAVFLVLLGHHGIEDVRLLGAAFGLIMFGAVIGPAFPEAMSNETWVMVQVGLAAGLIAGVAWSLIRPVIAADRVTATCAVIIVAVVMGLFAVVTTRAFVDQQEARQAEMFEDFGES